MDADDVEDPERDGARSAFHPSEPRARVRGNGVERGDNSPYSKVSIKEEPRQEIIINV